MSEAVGRFDASVADEKASRVGPAGIDIAYACRGRADVPVVLLIMGLAAQSAFTGRTRFAMACSKAAFRSSASIIAGFRALHTLRLMRRLWTCLRHSAGDSVVGVVHALGYGG